MKKLCAVTATRAEYGLLKPLMNAINAHQEFELQLLVTGAHLSPEFGNTYTLIEQEGFYINKKVEMLLSADTGSSIVKSMGLGMIGYADAFSRLNPDAIIILGDRYEMLAVASSASAMKIPIIHLHGGEITEGAYDDSFRHAITKLSHLHFASTESHRERIIQLGEQPQNVFNVGAIGIDNIVNLPLLSKEALEQDLGIRFAKYNYQVTFHPETLADLSAEEQFKVLLQAIKNQKESFFVFTKSNADTNGRIINRMIDEFVTENPHIAKAFTSLGSLKFLSLLKHSNAIIGNSSSGIIEAPSLHTPTINIGDRQKGRMQAKTIINCVVDQLQIEEAIDRTQDEIFMQSIKNLQNPYGNGDTTNKIMKIIESTDFSKLLIKKFYDK
ncbi:UDP-N-acetylglucosamine 2-epimerase [Chryseobacterium populi]|uniref:UDP-N-acetyl-D-glucosamine 2-epimerase, UDP-hydrolysing n=1 Tax=Chryseobacterium populi TaxID=1144316 RepID=J3CMW1_9FLAO|nr:UDP-N-acetylglucosamine 2-epimerase [Chryseobacterium populi]EJL74899.1 UDP-N-acetyl-D-glucosamine 2-epimerase, UDP-hydrolysing [Chryseobacterium populi]